MHIQTVALCQGLALLCIAAGANPQDNRASDIALRERAHGVVRAAMGLDPLKGMHAAEVLAWDGYGAEVTPVFRKQLSIAKGQTLIGVWRVLAQSESSAATRERYVHKVRDAALDTKGPYAEFAIESLGKLGYAGREAPLVELAANGQPVMRVLAQWVIANSGEAKDEAALAELLDLPDSRNRGIAAYALRFLHHLRPATVAKLQSVYSAEPATGAGRIFFASTLYVHGPRENRAALRSVLYDYARTGDQEARYQSLLSLGRWATRADLPRLARFLTDKESDIRIAAAHSILVTLARRGKAE